MFQVEDVDLFWMNLFKAEMYYPNLSSENSLMLPSHTRVYSDAGDTYYVPVFVFNPLFYMFWRGKFGMDVREVAPDENGFVSWKNIKPWFPV